MWGLVLLITSASACDIAFEDWPNVFMHYSLGLVIGDFACVCLLKPLHVVLI